MDGTKNWWQSKTMWAGIVTLVIGVLGSTGLSDMEGQQDVIVEKIMEILTAIGSLIVLYGRATAQSAITKKPPASTAGVLLLCVMLIAGGCISAQQNPRANLVASQKIFAATVDSLTALIEADKFTSEEASQIVLLANLGQVYLGQWKIEVKAGRDSPNIIQSFRVVLNKLIEYQIMKGGDTL